MRPCSRSVAIYSSLMPSARCSYALSFCKLSFASFIVLPCWMRSDSYACKMFASSLSCATRILSYLISRCVFSTRYYYTFLFRAFYSPALRNCACSSYTVFFNSFACLCATATRSSALAASTPAVSANLSCACCSCYASNLISLSFAISVPCNSTSF